MNTNRGLMVVCLVSLIGLSFSPALAAFKIPNFLTPYIPAGFVIDEPHSSSQNVGMFISTNVVARKVNELPKPFKTPEYSDLTLGYAEPANTAYLEPMWQEAKQNAEKESKSQTSPVNQFLEKETMSGGGEIYWYQGMNFNAQGAKDEAGQLAFYAAKIIKKLNKGILSITIEGYVGERDVIRKCFQVK